MPTPRWPEAKPASEARELRRDPSNAAGTTAASSDRVSVH